MSLFSSTDLYRLPDSTISGGHSNLVGGQLAELSASHKDSSPVATINLETFPPISSGMREAVFLGCLACYFFLLEYLGTKINKSK